MANYAPSPNWDLENIFPGGCAGTVATDAVEATKKTLADLTARASDLPSIQDQESASVWARFLRDLEASDDHLGQLFSFAHCHASANVADQDARSLIAALSAVWSVRSKIDVPLRAELGKTEDAHFATLLDHPDLSHMRTHLTELRAAAAISMAPDLEKLHEELAQDGFHAWGRLYDDVSGGLKVEVDRGDGPETLSTEQAKQLLDSPDEALRTQVAGAIDSVWHEKRDVFAAALNHINGYRQTLYARRGIDELELPLRGNRIGRKTLETMFSVLSDFRPTLSRFLAAKAKHLGLPKLRHYDVSVSLGEGGASVSYEEAQDFISESFHTFSEDLGNFATHAFLNRWIEVEDRPGKRQGGFCTGVPLNKESRIFMTYGGKASAVQTLAHELGHAYHNWVLRDMPRRQSEFTSSLAETASTFAETVVREAAYRNATDEKVRLGLLDRKLTDAVSFAMNIPARFHFERAMYSARAKAELTADQLCEITLSAFSSAYNDSLAEHDRMFWASKLHFYITEEPFYNFPYSVGYLFSLGLYARALEEGPSFAKKYDETLKLTGYRSCEQVANQALGVNLEEPDFWNSALALIAADVEAFEALTP